MTFTLSGPSIDFLVLTIISNGETYGYQISQLLKKVSNAKDSTLYPVLKRLQENGYVDAYDQPFQGRNRKYYRITEKGTLCQKELLNEWREHISAIEEIIQGGIEP